MEEIKLDIWHIEIRKLTDLPGVNWFASFAIKVIDAYVLKAASEAAERTSEMKACAGRASYVNVDLLKKPDAGAKACAIWLSAIFTVYAKSVHGSNAIML